VYTNSGPSRKSSDREARKAYVETEFDWIKYVEGYESLWSIALSSGLNRVTVPAIYKGKVR
jgi:hypothetical protein